MSQLGPIAIETVDTSIIESNPFFCPDANAAEKWDEYMRALKKQGDSVGAKITVVAKHVPVGFSFKYAA